MSCFFPEIDPFYKIKEWYKNNSCWIKLIVIVLLGVSLVFNVYQYELINYFKKTNYYLSIEKEGK